MSDLKFEIEAEVTNWLSEQLFDRLRTWKLPGGSKDWEIAYVDEDSDYPPYVVKHVPTGQMYEIEVEARVSEYQEPEVVDPDQVVVDPNQLPCSNRV